MRHIIPHVGYEILCASLDLPREEADLLIDRSLVGLRADVQPSILHMVGIPGSGKTTYVRQLNQTNTLIIGCDDIMEELSGYQTDRKKLGIKDAFLKWELCAREIAYELLLQGVDLGLNITMDFNGANPVNVAMLEYLKNYRGYKVSVVAMLVDQDIALQRIQARDRYVPPKYIPQRASEIERLLPKYKRIADSYEEHRITNRGFPEKRHLPLKMSSD